MSLEQQIVCILQSKHQQMLKMPIHERESRTYRPIVNTEAVGSADVTRYVLPRWRQPVYTSYSSDVHRLFINGHIMTDMYDCLSLLFMSKFLF